jgi:hypothetical protein
MPPILSATNVLDLSLDRLATYDGCTEIAQLKKTKLQEVTVWEEEDYCIYVPSTSFSVWAL